METVQATTTSEALLEFLVSDMKIAKLECGTDKKAHNEFNLFAYRIRKDYQGMVKVYQRGTALFFERM